MKMQCENLICDHIYNGVCMIDKGCEYIIIPEKSDITCPFCNTDDFDLPGLKVHLERGHCEIFNKIKTDDIKTLF